MTPHRSPTWWARQIALRRVAIVTAASMLLSILTGAGMISAGVSDQIIDIVHLVLWLAGAVTGAVWAQTGTTPADPRLAPTSMRGAPLVEVDPGRLATAPDMRSEPGAMHPSMGGQGGGRWSDSGGHVRSAAQDPHRMRIAPYVPAQTADAPTEGRYPPWED